MAKLRLFIGIFVLFLLVGCSKNVLPETEQPVATGTEFLMSTVVEQRWYGANSEQAYDEIVKSLKDIEGKLSLYQDNSEIALINQNAGIKAVEVSDMTYQMIKLSLEYSEKSDGRFDITIAPLTQLWDIMGDSPKVPSEEEIATAKSFIDYRQVLLNEDDRSVQLLKSNMSIDLGGVAKGMAASVAAEIAAKHQVSGYLSIGGNMMVLGKKPSGEDFRFGVRDPKGGVNDFMAVVTLDGMTMATTGTYERHFEEGGVRYHHVLDPFTGYPAQSDLISVTVISKDGALADYLSTAVFMEGSAGLEGHLSAEGYYVIAIDQNNRVYTSKGYRDHITPVEDEGYEFIGMG